MAQIRPLRIRVTRRAAAHLASIEAYIALDNPHAARRVGAKLRSAFEMLCHFPGLGRIGKVPGTREWVVRGLPYLVVYSASDVAIDILAVFHTAREIRDT